MPQNPKIKHCNQTLSVYRWNLSITIMKLASNVICVQVWKVSAVPKIHFCQATADVLCQL